MIGSVGVPVVVATPGTPVAISSVLPTPGKHISIHGIMFQALPENQGLVYIGFESMDIMTRTNVLAFLAIPTTNFIPTFSAALTIAPNGLNLGQFYVDADQAGDGVIITYLQT